jgi:hypothetical protein
MQYPYSPYNESSFVDPFFESYLVEPVKKAQPPKLHLDIPYVDPSFQFLSPSVLSTYDVGLEQIFQPLLDDSSPLRNVSTPAFIDPGHFHFHPEVLQNVYMEIPQVQQPEHIQEDELPEDEQEEENVSKKEIHPERVWSTSYKNESLVGDGEVQISLKTRREKPTTLVPERLYSSLKYEMQITATGEFVRSLPFLLARISVVDAITLQPISKNNKAVTKGENESALTHPPNGPGNIIKGTIKVQFDSSISYHHDKKEVCLEMSFFMNEALDQPILTKRTGPVKMFARKPNKKHGKNAPSSAPKRKREADAEEENLPKIAKVQQHQQQQPSSSFQLADFERRLDDLVEQSRHLSYEDRQRATGLILTKFGLPFVFTAPDPYNLYPQSNQYHQI